MHFFVAICFQLVSIECIETNKRKNKMIKVEIEKLENFLKVKGWYIYEIGERKRGHYVYATEDDYSDGIKPAGVEVFMIQLI